MTDTLNVLYLSYGNSCRSHIAEGWTRLHGKDLVDVQSASIKAHGKNPRAIAIMEEVGIDISAQESTIINDEILQRADVVVTVSGHADEQCPVLPPDVLKIHWPLADPAKATGTEKEIMEQFRATCDEVEIRVRSLLSGFFDEDEL